MTQSESPDKFTDSESIWEAEQISRARDVFDRMFKPSLVPDQPLSTGDVTFDLLEAWADLTNTIRSSLDGDSIWYFVDLVEERALAERGSRGGTKRHERDAEAKAAVFKWCDANREPFIKMTLDQLAWHISSAKVVPHAVGTIRKWLTDYKKQFSSSRR